MTLAFVLTWVEESEGKEPIGVFSTLEAAKSAAIQEAIERWDLNTWEDATDPPRWSEANPGKYWSWFCMSRWDVATIACFTVDRRVGA